MSDLKKTKKQNEIVQWQYPSPLLIAILQDFLHYESFFIFQGHFIPNKTIYKLKSEMFKSE